MATVRLLVLGGTEFVGRAVVNDALERGWHVTTLNRGSTPEDRTVTELHGDRSRPGGLGALGENQWDIVVDTWSGPSFVVRDAAKALRNRAGCYIYISSRSVYEYPTAPDADESFPVVESTPDSTSDDYAIAKAGGELAVKESFGEHSLIARAGLILGPYENIGRLPWWLNRIHAGGTVVAPGPKHLGLQYVDARDLATWCLDAAIAGLSGPYNIVSPQAWATMDDLLSGCIEATASSATLHWMKPETILAADVQPWTELPIWLPPGELHETLFEGDVTRALATGLRCRPLGETIADTWQWLQNGPPQRRVDRPALGIDQATEQRLLNLN